MFCCLQEHVLLAEVCVVVGWNVGCFFIRRVICFQKYVVVGRSVRWYWKNDMFFAGIWWAGVC